MPRTDCEDSSPAHARALDARVPVLFRGTITRARLVREPGVKDTARRCGLSLLKAEQDVVLEHTVFHGATPRIASAAAIRIWSSRIAFSRRATLWCLVAGSVAFSIACSLARAIYPSRKVKNSGSSLDTPKVWATSSRVSSLAARMRPA